MLSAAPRRARRAARRLARLRDCTSGLALTEFAFALPILLALGLLGLESANFAMAHLRISNSAVMTADNAARVRESIDKADVIELLMGAKMSGSGIRFGENGRIVLSSVEVNPGGTGQWIRWQRCDGLRNTPSLYGAQGAGQNNASLQGVGPAGNQISAQPGTAVMMVEVVYDYQPIIPNSFLEGREIRYESAFNVRQRTDQAIKNAGNIPTGQLRTCNLVQS